MPQFIFTNLAASRLAAELISTATTLTLESGSGSKFPNPLPFQQFTLTLKANATDTNPEIVYVTARNGDVCTVLRAQEGTLAKTFPLLSTAEHLYTAGTASAFFQTAYNPTTRYLTQNGVFNNGVMVYTTIIDPDTPDSLVNHSLVSLNFKVSNTAATSVQFVFRSATYTLVDANGDNLSGGVIKVAGVYAAFVSGTSIYMNVAREATTTKSGYARFATDAEVAAGTDNNSTITPLTLNAKIASAGQAGIIKIATAPEVLAGTDNTKAVSPLGLGSIIRPVADLNPLTPSSKLLQTGNFGIGKALISNDANACIQQGTYWLPATALNTPQPGVACSLEVTAATAISGNKVLQRCMVSDGSVYSNTITRVGTNDGAGGSVYTWSAWRTPLVDTPTTYIYGYDPGNGQNVGGFRFFPQMPEVWLTDIYTATGAKMVTVTNNLPLMEVRAIDTYGRETNRAFLLNLYLVYYTDGSLGYAAAAATHGARPPEYPYTVTPLSAGACTDISKLYGAKGGTKCYVKLITQYEWKASASPTWDIPSYIISGFPNMYSVQLQTGMYDIMLIKTYGLDDICANNYPKPIQVYVAYQLAQATNGGLLKAELSAPGTNNTWGPIAVQGAGVPGSNQYNPSISFTVPPGWLYRISTLSPFATISRVLWYEMTPNIIPAG